MPKVFSRKRRFFQPILVGLMIGLICAAGFSFGILQSWSHRATDRLFIHRIPDSHITIVAINDASIATIGRWPWPRKIHAELINKLTDAGAKVIAYDVNFPDSSDPADDTALADALRASGRVVLPVELKLEFTSSGLRYAPGSVLASIPEIASAAAAAGHSNTPPDADGIMRRIPLLVRAPDGGSIDAFAVQVAKFAGLSAQLSAAPVDHDHRMMVNFDGPPFHTFRTISAAAVLRGTADLSVIKNGIVFVGSTAPDLHDSLLVPTSNGVLMPGAEIHASIFDTIAGEHWLRPVPFVFMGLFILLLGVLVGLIVPFIRARWSIPVLLVVWIAVLIGAFMAFDRGFIVDIVWPTFTLVFGYAAVTLQQRVQSDRDRRELKSAFSRYVSESVVNSIIKNPSQLKLGGERKRMSVLFSDIRGFTTISEGLPSERLVEVLNMYLTRMTDIVFQHQGVLDKYIGDAVMAFWNAPFDQPDHAERAVRTALDMRDALVEMNRTKAFGDIELHIGIGVNSGDMVVGNVGGTVRFDYTVIGDNVNLGSRLEGLTKEYGVGIIISGSTAKEIASKIFCRRLDKVAVKGKKEQVMIYEVVASIERVSLAERKLVKDFETALDAYFARDFEGAITKCDVILTTTPNDGPTKNLKVRAEHFRLTPPADDWVGTWVFTKK